MIPKEAALKESLDQGRIYNVSYGQRKMARVVTVIGTTNYFCPNMFVVMLHSISGFNHSWIKWPHPCLVGLSRDGCNPHRCQYLTTSTPLLLPQYQRLAGIEGVKRSYS